MSKVSYLSIANSDFEFLNKLVDSKIKNNNYCIFLCQQICEKLLRSVVEQIDADNIVMESHNLLRIMDVLKKNRYQTDVSDGDLSILSSYYVISRYPCVDFEYVTDERLKMCMRLTVAIHKEVNDWHSKRIGKELFGN